MQKYVIGLDYGSDSARALVVNAETGEILATSVKYYPRWKKGLYCNPKINQWRQHPKDYLEVLESTVTDALGQCAKEVAENVVGIAFDTTGSTPAFTDESGTPLAMLPEFAENTTNIAAWQYVLNKASVRKEAAFRFLEYAASREGSIAYSEYMNRLPARVDIIREEDLERRPGHPGLRSAAGLCRKHPA